MSANSVPNPLRDAVASTLEKVKSFLLGGEPAGSASAEEEVKEAPPREPSPNGKAAEPNPSPRPAANPFSDLNSVLEKWFYKPDLQAIRIVMGAVQAHYLKIGDPAWLFYVAPPGSGKTSISVMGAGNLPGVHILGDVTEKTFLSGFHGHESPGLLEKLGEAEHIGQTSIYTGDGIFLIKDFTTVLSMKREKRAAILGQLREIHDGEYRADYGTGKTKIWRGQVSIVAAVTPALDRHYSVFSTLGERFLQIRSHRPDSEEAGQWAILQQGREKEIRKQCRAAVKKLFDASNRKPPNLSPTQISRIAAVAEVVAIGRTHVYRNNYGNKEIEYVPEPEANTRLSKGLAAIARGLAALNRRGEVAEADLQDIFRVAMDCLPVNRRDLLAAVMEGRDVTALRMARTVRNRQLEELEELGLLTKDETADVGWRLTEKADRLLSTAGLRGF